MVRSRFPEFDPFWKLVEESGIVTGMHASDSGYTRYTNEWEGVRDEFTPFTGGSGFESLSGAHGRAITDTVASAIGHGLCTRFPGLKIAPVENGSAWVRPLFARMAEAYEKSPHDWDEDPIDTFTRCIFVHPFHEDDPIGLIDLIGVDNVLFGSDYPHPEGMADPITFVDELAALDEDDVAKVMGGNLARIMNVAV
ncbi:MAG: amidohydrolase family protein [Acidimicrobiales bacterium]